MALSGSNRNWRVLNSVKDPWKNKFSLIQDNTYRNIRINKVGSRIEGTWKSEYTFMKMPFGQSLKLNPQKWQIYGKLLCKQNNTNLKNEF